MTTGVSRLMLRLMLSVLLCSFTSLHVFSMNTDSTNRRARVRNYNSPYSMMNMGYSGMASNAIARIEQFRQMADVIADEKRDVARREAQLAAGGLSSQEYAELSADIQNSHRLLESLGRCRRNMVDPKSAAYRLLVGGLAGKDAKGYIDEFNQVDNVGDAIKQGLAFRFAKGVGDVLGKRITAACEFFLGGACDFLIHKTIGLWGDLTSVLFHESKDPFTVDILKQWQFLVKRSLEDVERLLKDGMKDTLRGYDMTKRRMDVLSAPDDQQPGMSKNQSADILVDPASEKAHNNDAIACDVVASLDDEKPGSGKSELNQEETQSIFEELSQNYNELVDTIYLCGEMFLDFVKFEDDEVLGNELPGASKDYAQEQLKTVWAHLAHTYADIYDMMIEEIDFRKGYYDEESMVIRHANGLKSLLSVLSRAMLSTNSITEFYAKLDSTQPLIPAIRKELDNLFIALIEQIKPPSYSLKAKDNALDSYGRKQGKERYGYGSDDSYSNGESWG